MYSISVVIPVYNGAATLPDLIERLGTVLPVITSKFEVLLINDGSKDNSWEVIKDQSEAYHWVYGLDLLRNYGQHGALLAGIREARHDLIVTMDDDLQHPPEEIPKLIKKLDEGYDVVYGSPARMRHSLWRNLASGLTKIALQGAMGVETARRVSAFRAFRTCLRKAFVSYQGSFTSIDVLLTWTTTQFASVEVEHHPRKLGTSNYTVWKLISHAINMLTGFTTIPLQLASLIGFFFTFFGILVFLYVVGRFLILGYSVAGFPFLASIIAIFSGAQLFALGVIGEYLARMHFRMMGKPPYGIRTRTGSYKDSSSDTLNIERDMDLNRITDRG